MKILKEKNIKRKVKSMADKSSIHREALEENEKAREHRLRDAFNAMGYVNLALAK